MTAAAQISLAPDVEAWLRSGAGRGLRLERVIATSISWVFLFEDRALKLKKPVDFGFLDFSTPQQRLWAAERELAFNRMTAPDIYRRVVRIGRDPQGAVCELAAGLLVDAAVEMRRFDPEATARSFLPMDGALAEGLGREIARAHATAEVAPTGGAEGLARIARSNAQHLRQCADVLGADRVEALVGAVDAELARRGALLDSRLDQGLCRACHGDLHLGNVLIEAGRPVLFDCIEFSDEMRHIDVLYDIAFLLMDLAFSGDAAGANRVFNAWLDEGARHGLADPSGLATLPLFQSVRASVRAHVRAREGAAEEARRYLDYALGAIAPPAPRLLAIGGLSGSGKTTRARRLAPKLGSAPGAAILRSDELRKRLFGLAPTDRLDPAGYSVEVSERVYRDLRAQAAASLRAGCSVVVDAVFLRPEERDAIGAVAAEAGVAFEGLWLEAPRPDLEARLAARRGDASDADAAVLARQLEVDPGPIVWRRG